jgi:hypothetical protein
MYRHENLAPAAHINDPLLALFIVSDLEGKRDFLHEEITDAAQVQALEAELDVCFAVELNEDLFHFLCNISRQRAR